MLCLWNDLLLGHLPYLVSRYSASTESLLASQRVRENASLSVLAQASVCAVLRMMIDLEAEQVLWTRPSSVIGLDIELWCMCHDDYIT